MEPEQIPLRAGTRLALATYVETMCFSCVLSAEVGADDLPTL